MDTVKRSQEYFDFDLLSVVEIETAKDICSPLLQLGAVKV